MEERIMKITRMAIVVPVVLALGACGRSAPLATAPMTGASSNVITIPFDASHFTSPQPNAYFPLTVGATWNYASTSKKGGNETNVVTVTSDAKTILGVQVAVVHDVVYIADGSISEDTFDWYAADKDGNVWYFGEDTKTYDHGVLVTTEGSWEAGKNGAQPGIIFLAHPEVGDVYQQENSPGIVADMARIIGVGETITVHGVTYENMIETTEWTPIEPGNRAHKFYAPGVGTVLETSTRQGGERVELVSVSGL
jgi:hypothetical protein